MQYTEILYLVKRTEQQDEIGNIYYEETQNKVYAKKNTVGTKEFYNAIAVGITPTAELQIKSSNYDGEDTAIYNETKYSVIRTVNKGRDIVLVLGTKQGVN